MITALDKFGRVLIPKKIREILGILPETRLVISEKGNKIIIEALHNENAFVEKDGMLVFTGDLAGDFEMLLEKERINRERKLL